MENPTRWSRHQISLCRALRAIGQRHRGIAQFFYPARVVEPRQQLYADVIRIAETRVAEALAAVDGALDAGGLS
jgi:hypothetical protein